MPCSIINNIIKYQIFDLNFTASKHKYSLTKANSGNYHEVLASRLAVKLDMNTDKIATINQVHGNEVYDIDQHSDFNIEPTADALVTSKSKILLAIQTADCVPILLYCVEKKIIGAVHAGWKSVEKNILKNTIDLMRTKGAKNINAIIGPSIQKQSYEVGEEIKERFSNIHNDYDKFFTNSSNNLKYMFDLPGLVRYQMNKHEVKITYISNDDTYSQQERYPSYRRATHTNTKYQHNILSTIMMM